MASGKEHWQEHLQPWLETAKTIVGILAILVGGYWTYLKFIRTEAPLFEKNARVEWSITQPVDQGEDCMQSFNVRFINTGKSVFTINKVLTRAWKFYFQRSDAEFATLMDLDKIQTVGQLVLQKEFPDPAFAETMRWYPLVGKYRSGEEYSHEFSFLFKKEDKAWILLKTEIFFEGEATPKVAGIWRAVCVSDMNKMVQPPT
jgi:hypothetical protein